MLYPDLLDFLYSQLPMYQRVGKAAYKADLSNTIALCKAIGNPERKIKAIHIAGTNGKGSVSHYLAAILQSAGYKVGLFTSPHYLDFRERIKVNGRKILKQDVLSFYQQYRLDVKELQPSFFEFTAGLAFHHFAKQKVDIAIIETGMGGRLDSTNVVKSLLSIITNIGKDHQQFLGETLPEIAGEKAGIIKKGVPVVIGETQEEVKSVFIAKAKALNSPIHFADETYSLINPEVKMGRTSLLLYTDAYREGEIYDYFESGLLGNYQLKNIVTVLKAVELLRQGKLDISREALNKGFFYVLKLTRMLGRWQVLSQNPLTICDAAHNEDGLKYVVKQLEANTYDNLHIVFGTVNDKKLEAILKLLPKKATYYWCKASVPRALNAKELQSKAATCGLKGHTFSDVASALKASQKVAKKDDLIFIGGSTFVVADALKEF